MKKVAGSSIPGHFFYVLWGLFFGLILADKIIEAVKRLHGFRLRRGYGVGVDVRGGAGLGMAQLLGYHHEGNAVGNHQCGVGVPQTVDCNLRHTGSGNEAAEPLRHAVGENQGSRCFSDARFMQIEELKRIIKESKFKKKDRAAMQELVKRLQRIQSVDKALNKMQKAGLGTDGLLDRFAQLGVSPIPLRKNFCAQSLPGPVELLRSVSEEEVRVEYVKARYR